MRTKSLSSCLLAGVIGLFSLLSSASTSTVAASAGAQQASGTARVRPTLPTNYRWIRNPSPNYGSGSNLLRAVSALAPNNVWAVGYSDATYTGGRTLIEHLAGGSWHIVDSPNMATGPNFLGGVAAVAADNVWAAGGYYDGSNQFTLIEHWNGTAWSIVPSPNPSPNSGGNAITGMAAVSADDIWAAGAYNTGPGAPDNTMIEHWNGTSWQIVPTPGQDSLNVLSTVSARSATDAWAVGFSALDWSYDNLRPLAMHWDGTAWNVVSVPMPADAIKASLTSVGMGGQNNVWAVGSYITSDGVYHAMALQWNGQEWTVMPGYTLSGDVFTEFTGVAVSSQGDVWAIGWGGTSLPPTWSDRAYPGAQSLILRWQNNSWQVADSPQPGVGNELWGLAALSGPAWAVGNYVSSGNGPSQTLITFYGPHFSSAEARSNMLH